jgi:hypothetical protein
LIEKNVCKVFLTKRVLYHVEFLEESVWR